MERGAQPGNDNAVKNKPWIDAIRRALAQGEPERLRKLAEALLNKAADGDMGALRELGDRLDGKPAQAVHLANEDGKPFEVAAVEYRIVDPRG